MISYLLDTNCLISFVTDRNALQQKRMLVRFRDAGKMQAEIHIIPNVIDEFVYVLQGVYATPADRVAAMISGLMAEPGVVFHEEQRIPDVLAIWPGRIKEYGDAIIASSAATLGLPVMTLDAEFARAMKKMGMAVMVP